MQNEKKEMIFSQEQRVYMLKTLWIELFTNIFSDRSRINDHAYNRLIGVRDKAVELLDNHEKAPETLNKYIEENENIIYVHSFAKDEVVDCLNAIKDVCPTAQEGVPDDFFLGRYGKACRHLYGSQ